MTRLRPVVVDLNHADASSDESGRIIDHIDFEKAYAAGIRGIIHKATEGTTFVDPLYHSRRERAVAAGMLWGAYHFMRPGDVGNQASFFLHAVGPSRQPPFTRYVLDYEDPKLGLWQAERWLEVIQRVTGQFPWLYSGFLVREQTERTTPPPGLAQYPLWLAEYSTSPKIPRPWKNFALWQRSGDGEGPGPHDIPGIGRREDVNWFDGSDDDLAAAWSGQPRPPATEEVA